MRTGMMHYFPAFNVADSAITVGRRAVAARRLAREPRAQRGASCMQVLLANPRGFCAGVDRAIDIVERAIELFGAPIYVRHEVVHNRHVVERLRALGAVFVEELHEVPDGSTVIFSAHGVSSAVEAEAKHARPHGVRCHLPAGDQGAHGSAALRPRGPRCDPDRPRRPSGGRRHHGPLRCLLRRQHPPRRERRGCATSFEVRDPAQPGLRDPDHAVGG